MSLPNTAEEAIAADLASARFLVGVMRGHWRQVSYKFPILIGAVAAIEPDGRRSEYYFRFELTGFPGIAPEVKIWNITKNSLLDGSSRPKGSERVNKAFQVWGDNSVYRPWDRHSGRHNNFSQEYPELAWHPQRDLAFIFEDLHDLLTSNAVSHPHRPAA